MKLVEILIGLRNGAFQQGEELISDEGFWFKITDDGKLLSKIDDEVFVIGELATVPLPISDNS